MKQDLWMTTAFILKVVWLEIGGLAIGSQMKFGVYWEQDAINDMRKITRYRIMYCLNKTLGTWIVVRGLSFITSFKLLTLGSLYLGAVSSVSLHLPFVGDSLLLVQNNFATLQLIDLFGWLLLLSALQGESAVPTSAPFSHHL